MKIWIKDSFGRPHYGYDRYEVVNGKRKKIKEKIFTIPTTSGGTQEVDLYAFLKVVEQAEKRFKTLRNIKVCWSFQEGSRSFGAFHADYDPGCTNFWITFERLESDEEEATRERPAINKTKETKKLLTKQLNKYIKVN